MIQPKAVKEKLDAYGKKKKIVYGVLCYVKLTDKLGGENIHNIQHKWLLFFIYIYTSYNL